MSVTFLFAIKTNVATEFALRRTCVTALTENSKKVVTIMNFTKSYHDVQKPA